MEYTRRTRCIWYKNFIDRLSLFASNPVQITVHHLHTYFLNFQKKLHRPIDCCVSAQCPKSELKASEP